jgi:hypothetical protein
MRVTQKMLDVGWEEAKKLAAENHLSWAVHMAKKDMVDAALTRVYNVMRAAEIQESPVPMPAPAPVEK